MKTILCKHGTSLVAEDADSLDALAKIKDGKLVLVEVRRKRNLQHHRLYFALIKVVHENMESKRYPTPDTLHEAIKVACGLRTEFVLPNGVVGFIPGSINFGEMTQDAFEKFYNKVCDIVCAHFIPGLKSEELKAEVLQMVGHGRAS